MFISLDSFGVSCLVLEISAVNVVLTAPKNTHTPETMAQLHKISCVVSYLVFLGLRAQFSPIIFERKAEISAADISKTR